MSSKKCISLENFDPDDLVFDYVKEGKMSDGTSFSKTPISVLRSDGTTGPHMRVPCTWPRIPVFRLVFRRILCTEVIPFLWFLWIKIILQRSRKNLLR